MINTQTYIRSLAIDTGLLNNITILSNSSNYTVAPETIPSTVVTSPAINTTIGI